MTHILWIITFSIHFQDILWNSSTSWNWKSNGTNMVCHYWYLPRFHNVPRWFITWICCRVYYFLHAKRISLALRRQSWFYGKERSKYLLPLNLKTWNSQTTFNIAQVQVFRPLKITRDNIFIQTPYYKSSRITCNLWCACNMVCLRTNNVKGCFCSACFWIW